MKAIKFFILLIIFFILAFNVSYAVNVASKGMGGVGVANSELPINSAFVNSALLSNIKSFSLYSSYASFITDVSKIEVSAAYPFLGGVVGVSVARDSISGLDYTTGYDPVTGNPILTQVEYFSQIIMPSYSRKIENGLGGINSFGVGLKLVSDGVSNFSDSASGIDLDLGVTGGKKEEFLWGVSLVNIAPTKKTWKTSLGQREEDIPSAIVFGVGKYFEDEKMYVEINAKKDIDKSQNPLLFNIGASYKPYKNVVLRGGIAQNAGAGVGTVASNITFGVGVDLSSFNFDYAFYPQAELNENSHFVSFAYTQPVSAKPVETPKIGLTVNPFVSSAETFVFVSAEVIAPKVEIKKQDKKEEKKSTTQGAKTTIEASSTAQVSIIPIMEIVIDGQKYSTNEVRISKTINKNNPSLTISTSFENRSLNFTRSFKSMFVASPDASSTTEPVAVLDLTIIETKPIPQPKPTTKATADAKAVQATPKFMTTSETFTFSLIAGDLKYATKEVYNCEFLGEDILINVPRLAKNPQLFVLNKSTNSWELNRISIVKVDSDKVVFKYKRVNP